MAKTRTWICVIVVILILSAAASFFILRRGGKEKVANIYVDGELMRSVDLSALSEPVRFTVVTDNGVNVVLAEPGRICVESADCPDKVCVKTGWLSDSAAPIVCLPHRVVIELSGGAEVDGEAG